MTQAPQAPSLFDRPDTRPIMMTLFTFCSKKSSDGGTKPKKAYSCDAFNISDRQERDCLSRNGWQGQAVSVPIFITEDGTHNSIENAN